MTISERLYNLRKEKKISQEELANVLGVSRQTVSKWETGESTPDFDKIIPLCDFYGITSDELISGKKDIVEAKHEDKKNKLARNIAISVALYIMSVITIILFGSETEEPVFGVCCFFFINAIATGIIIYSCMRYGEKKEEKQKKEDSKKNKIVKDVCKIIDLIGLVIYFIVSFLTGAWHITWIIFLIVGLCESIAKLAFNIKEGAEEDE